ncbi:MAG: aminodeoxychorismate lyase, partial [Candidatus Sulfotelmatobacter sp.]
MRRFLGLILVAVLAFAGWFAWALLTPVEPPGKTYVMLRPGFSTHRIAAELKSAGVIRSEKAFILWHYFH